jgi:hypothetical protein
VIFVYNAIDDFVMNNLKTYHGRDFKTAEATGLDLGPDKKTEEEEGEQGGGEGEDKGQGEGGMYGRREGARLIITTCSCVMSAHLPFHSINAFSSSPTDLRQEGRRQ